MTQKPEAGIQSDPEVRITRLLDATRPAAFDAWTNAGHMLRWWGPERFTLPDCQSDPRPGGAWRIVMRAPDGTDYPLKGFYREFAAPERIVMTVDCSEHPDAWHDLVDPNRDKGRGRPALDVLYIVTFEAVGERTKLTVTTRFGSIALRDAMLKMGMKQGWGQMLDRFARVVADI